MFILFYEISGVTRLIKLAVYIIVTQCQRQVDK